MQPNLFESTPPIRCAQNASRTNPHPPLYMMAGQDGAHWYEPRLVIWSKKSVHL